MSFILRNLSVLAYANGFTLWHYKSREDGQSAVGRPGYFDEAVDMLAGGDIMLVSSADGGRVVCVAAEEGRVRTDPML